MKNPEFRKALEILLSEMEKSDLKKLAKSLSLRERQELIELNKSIGLIKESYMLGPSGRACPACGGSGRI